MIKYKIGIENQATDALSRRVALLSTRSIEVVGFKKLKEDCLDFGTVDALLRKGPSREYSEYTF